MYLCVGYIKRGTKGEYKVKFYHLCQMGASGNLCASVYVSIDENAEATRAVTANVSSYRS